MELAGEIKAVVFNHRKIAVGDELDGRRVSSIVESMAEKLRVERTYLVVSMEADDGIIVRFKNVPILGALSRDGIGFVMFQEKEEGQRREYRIGDEVDSRCITKISVYREASPSQMPNFIACDDQNRCICRMEDRDAGMETWYRPFEAF